MGSNAKEKELWKKCCRRMTRWLLRKNYTASDLPQTETACTVTGGFFRNCRYKDEKWNYIANLPGYLKSVQNKHPVIFEDNKCNMAGRCTVKTAEDADICSREKNNNWVCFFYEETPEENYCFSFDIKLFSEFNEIQVAFRYRNLGNRLRFQIRDNREAVFECIREGQFYNRIYSKPLTLSLQEWHNIRLTACENSYSFAVDGQVILHILAKREDKRLGNGLALILYNRDDTAKIQCGIRNAVIGISGSGEATQARGRDE